MPKRLMFSKFVQTAYTVEWARHPATVKAKAPQQKQMSDAKGAGHEQVNHNRRRGRSVGPKAVAVQVSR